MSTPAHAASPVRDHADAVLAPRDGTPLYVHFPFCAAKCTYCDFYSIPAAGHDLAGALDALLAEARARAPRHPRTLFLGGGTPSLYPTSDLVAFLDALDDLTGWRESAIEATVECNPESLDERKADALLSAGITRLSIGFQSLDPARLATFGRVHSVEQSFAAFRAARRAGVERLNVDLIYAAPGQGVDAWCDELERVLELGPDHLSAYNLTLEPGTALHRAHAEGRLTPLDDERELEQLFATRERCRAAGLEPYEISNFARPGEECAHNVAYWENREYVGIGPSAVSKVGIERFGNARSLAAWRAAVSLASSASTSAGPTPAWSERLGDLARLGETWWLGLRLARGLSPAEARERAGLGDSVGIVGATPASADDATVASTDPDCADPAVAVARELVGLGLLEHDTATGRYRLGRSGLPVADAIGRRFVELAPARPSR